MKSLRHRGPDGEGRFISADEHVGLGHARLSIIDLKTGAQPISNEDGSVHIVVNGELYDHERIRRELLSEGHHFRTASDSEVALHLYEDLGVQCLKQLRGEFAFVLWDDKNKVLIAARDRFGIKPLNYAEVDGTLYCGSEIKALFAAGVEPRWDHEQIYQQLFHFADADRTLFAGVQQIPPGHCLIATPSGSRLMRYWDFDYPTLDQIANEIDDEVWVERLRQELLEAVRLRLRADVPVGCYLSGGIDSSALIGMASKLLDEPIAAFTISFEDARYDEAAVAERMARSVGAPFHRFEIHDAIRADNFHGAVIHNETVTHGHMVAKYVLSERVQSLGYKVVLTGEGSDEIFAGYTPFRWDKIIGDQSLDSAGRSALFARVAQQEALFPPAFEAVSDPAFDSVRRRLGFVPSGFALSAARTTALRQALAVDFSREFGQRDVFAMAVDALDFSQLRNRPRLHQSLYLWSKMGLPNMMLRGLGDRSEMAHSIEGRLPFLDHEVVALAVQMPPSLKIKGVNEKYVLREAVRPFVTTEIFTRAKHQFSVPSALRGRCGEVLRDVVHSGTLDRMAFFEPARVRRQLEDLVHDRDRPIPAGGEYVILAVASLCVLQDAFHVQGI